ncbi:iron chelate uptake ABC transporter family permease subunit [Escherichia coli]|nr:iron chelate uptake ABC transporter family permease subunit [Escherichia coli]
MLAFALAGGVLLLMAVVVALSFGRDAHGWHGRARALLDDLMPGAGRELWRALFAGVMLAVAGCIIQRLTGNPMASPEVLGISFRRGAWRGTDAVSGTGQRFGWAVTRGSIGAAVTLLIIMIAAGRGGFSPHRMLLAGMALSTAFTMLLMMLQARRPANGASADLDFRSRPTIATDAQVWRTGIVMVILLAITPSAPPLADHFTAGAVIPPEP